MKWFRFTIPALLGLVVLVAADCALVRTAIHNDFWVVPLVVAPSFFLCANVLAIGITALIRQTRRLGRCSPFWLGFVLTSALTTIAAMLAFAAFPQTVDLWIDRLCDPLSPDYLAAVSNSHPLMIVGYVTLVCSVPLAVMDILGGCFFRVCQITLVWERWPGKRAQKP